MKLASYVGTRPGVMGLGKFLIRLRLGGEQSANSTLTTGSAGGGQAHPNLPPTLVVNYVIKT